LRSELIDIEDQLQKTNTLNLEELKEEILEARDQCQSDLTQKNLTKVEITPSKISRSNV
jgi:hypothetical protein